MKNLGYYNGKFGPLDEMTVPMNDRVCWFGDGVYDAGPCRNYHVFAMDEHVDRFFRSAAALDIRIPVTKDELKALLNDLVRKVDTGDRKSVGHAEADDDRGLQNADQTYHDGGQAFLPLQHQDAEPDPVGHGGAEGEGGGLHGGSLLPSRRTGHGVCPQQRAHPEGRHPAHRAAGRADPAGHRPRPSAPRL